jgi:hypothetical protein
MGTVQTAVSVEMTIQEALDALDPRIAAGPIALTMTDIVTTLLYLGGATLALM